MKLKTSPLFWLNQFYKLILLLGLITICDKAISQEKNPGIIESLERLLEVHKKQYDQSKLNIQSNISVLSNLNEIKDVHLNPQFVRSLIFHSDDKFLRLVQSDECKLLSVIENNLLKTIEGDIVNVLIDYKNSDNKSETAAIPKDDFFNYIYKKQCLNNREFATLFAEANFQRTVQGIKFTIPKTTNECMSIHQEWLANSFTPYLCHIQQIIKKSKNAKEVNLYKEKIPSLQRIYLDNLCENIATPSRFCENYLKSDIWNKIINAEAPAYKMSYKCQNARGLQEATPKDLQTCAAKFTNEPALCETVGTNNFPSNFPLQNCNLISDALLKSKLVTKYHDCPGNVDSEAITNIHRIVNHFDPRTIVTNKETCAGEASYTFARMNLDIKHQEGWPLKICFMNKVQNKENCIPYIPGTREDEPLSEDKVVAKILYQQQGAPAKTTCRIVDSKTYNPIRSDFKFGCFIVYNAETCTTLNCDKKVIWGEKPVEDIHYIGKPAFDYFTTAYINERYSFAGMLDELKNTQQRTIKNLTDMKFYLDSISSSIIHGVGCVEDILPEQFSRTAMNQCRPMPFIIDGYTIKKGETWIVLRASIDDLHTPRLVQWQNIFNAVSAYRELHPLNTWTLYGIKK